MSKNFTLLFAIGVCIVVSAVLYARLKLKEQHTVSFEVFKKNIELVDTPCTPTFVDGGGPYYQLNAPFREVLVPEVNNGEKLIVRGKVLANDCTTPLTDVVVDIWQANESGSYEDEWYRGQVKVNDNGEYTFTTVVPKGYGEGTGYRPPHIHFKIWRGTQELITSQMFLPASREQKIEEAYIMKVETKTEDGKIAHYGKHDIVLP